MAVGKEYIKVLESFGGRQVRIYPDAADLGVRVTPAELAEIRAALKGLARLEGGKSERWATGSSYTTRLGYEMDEGRVQGSQVKVSFNRDKFGGFLSIEFKATSWLPNERLGSKPS